MKVSVIGNGNVGMALYAYLKNFREIDQLVLVGRNSEKVKGEIEDYLDACVLESGPSPKLFSGSYEATAGSDILLYTAGPSVKAGQSRLAIVDENVRIVTEIFEQINQYCHDELIVCLSNPLDVLTYLLPGIAGVDPGRVVGTGTLLDSARLKRIIARIFEIDPNSVEAFVLGEHGASAVVPWSTLKIAGLSIDEFASQMLGEEATIKKNMLDERMKKAGYKIFDEKGSTAYGVANSAAEIVRAIIHDTRAILPVSTSVLDKYDIDGCALSVPCIIGKNGVMDTVHVKMNDGEKAALDQSAAIIRSVIPQ